jgi:hypothetical protein
VGDDSQITTRQGRQRQLLAAHSCDSLAGIWVEGGERHAGVGN